MKRRAFIEAFVLATLAAIAGGAVELQGCISAAGGAM
jgi:hypothetical protein